MTSNGHVDRHMDKWRDAYAQIQENPDELTLWEDLVDIIDSAEPPLSKASSPETIELFRFTFDGILARFPLLFGYWLKYAQWEFRLGYTARAEQVYERSVAAVPYSVELWTAYGQFAALTHTDAPTIRAVFERGVASIGNHFLAHKLWDAYLALEEREDDEARQFTLLLRIIQIPLHQYARYFERFRILAQTAPVEALGSPRALQQFEAEYELESAEEGSTQESETSSYAREDDLRRRFAYHHLQIYLKTQLAVSRRAPFENSITRPFFHVVYLGEAELVSWRRYLDFEEIDGSFESACLLYERALIPTAHNEELWLRYTRWLVAHGNYESARNAYRRGCILLPAGRPQLRLQYARFEEAAGNLEVARAIYDALLESLPGHVETILALSSLLSRMGGSPIEFVTEQISSAPSPDDQALLVKELARIHLRSGEIAAARAVFDEASSTCGSQSHKFWRYFLSFEASTEDEEPKTARLESVYNLIRVSGLDSALIKDLSHVYMTLLLTETSGTIQKYMSVDHAVHRSAVPVK